MNDLSDMSDFDLDRRLDRIDREIQLATERIDNRLAERQKIADEIQTRRLQLR